MNPLKFFLGVMHPCTWPNGFSEKAQQNKTWTSKQTQTFAQVRGPLWSPPKQDLTEKWPPFSFHGSSGQFGKIWVLLFKRMNFIDVFCSFLNIKLKILIIPNKKWNLYSVGLQEQLLKSDVSINILIRGIFFSLQFWRESENQCQYGLDIHNCLHMFQ